jgi:hypothetical protein
MARIKVAQPKAIVLSKSHQDLVCKVNKLSIALLPLLFRSQGLKSQDRGRAGGEVAESAMFGPILLTGCDLRA